MSRMTRCRCQAPIGTPAAPMPTMSELPCRTPIPAPRPIRRRSRPSRPVAVPATAMASRPHRAPRRYARRCASVAAPARRCDCCRRRRRQPPAAAQPAPGMPPISELKGRPIGRVLHQDGQGHPRAGRRSPRLPEEQRAARSAESSSTWATSRKPISTSPWPPSAAIELVSLEGMHDRPRDAIAAVPPQIATTNKVLPDRVRSGDQKAHRRDGQPRKFPRPRRSAIADGLRRHRQDRPTPIRSNSSSPSITRPPPKASAKSSANCSNDDTLKDLKNRGESIDLDSLKEAADSNPVRKLINLVLLQAIKDKASDIHFEPFEDEFKMRYRIDGVLYEMMPPPAHIAPAISSRIKVMANLDIAERRMPQDGRIELNVNNQPIDLRVSVLPTMFGECVVMRVLDRGNVSLDLDKLGMRDDDLTRHPPAHPQAQRHRHRHRPDRLRQNHHALFRPPRTQRSQQQTDHRRRPGRIRHRRHHPVPDQAGHRTDLRAAFSASMLRQDPDIILVGEIRDKETAEIAVQASLTGHLVFSTLHTNDAPSAIARLLDLGLEPFLVTATLEGIVAQRLVRKICLNCKTEYTPDRRAAHGAGASPRGRRRQAVSTTARAATTATTPATRAAMGLYEIMILDDDMRDLIIQHASTQVLRIEAKKRGMRTLRAMRPAGHLRRRHHHRRSRPRNPRRRHLIPPLPLPIFSCGAQHRGFPPKNLFIPGNNPRPINQLPRAVSHGTLFPRRIKMLKSSIVKWAVAAVLAVPAIPMFGSTIHHHKVVTRTHTHIHHTMTVTRHHTVSRPHRRTTLSAHRKLATHHRSSHRLTHKSNVRHTSMTSTSHYKVHVTKMPPTIDGINT